MRCAERTGITDTAAARILTAIIAKASVLEHNCHRSSAERYTFFFVSYHFATGTDGPGLLGKRSYPSESKAMNAGRKRLLTWLWCGS